MFTLIEQGEVYGPEPLGKTSVLVNGGAILKIGEIDASSLERLGIPLDVIDASGCFVTPGLIDPHEYLLGGSGEEGFSSQTPEISASESKQRVALQQSLGDFMALSAVLSCLAVELSKIANDLRLLHSGPHTGFDEIELAALQPGLSIMPGKVNPAVAEMLNMEKAIDTGKSVTEVVEDEKAESDDGEK